MTSNYNNLQPPFNSNRNVKRDHTPEPNRSISPYDAILDNLGQAKVHLQANVASPVTKQQLKDYFI